MSKNNIGKDKTNFLSQFIKKIENIVAAIFKRQLNETKDLPPYTEEEFDRDLETVLQKEKGTELEYIGILKDSELLPNDPLIYSLIVELKNRDFHINKVDENGDTLLHVAVQKKGLEHLVVALLNNGADATKANKSRYTPIELAHSDKMKAAIQQFVFEKEKYDINVSGYIRKAIENKSVMPISDVDLDIKFPPVVIKIEDIAEGYISEIKVDKTFLDNIQPYLDENIQGEDDVYVPGIDEHVHFVGKAIEESKKLLQPAALQVQKITDQKKLSTQDTSRGGRTE